VYGYQSNINKHIDCLIEQENHTELLCVAEQYLSIDPNNSQWLYLKFKALLGLGRGNEDIGFLRKLCWYRSSCDDVFYHLALAYSERGERLNALLASVFCLSVNAVNTAAKTLQASLLHTLGKQTLKVSFLKADRIGHLTSEPDAWLREKAISEFEDVDVLHLFIAGEPVCNDAVLTMLARSIQVHQNAFFHKLHMTRGRLLSNRFFAKMPYDENHNARHPTSIDNKILELCRAYNSHERVLYLSETEKKQAQNEAQELGFDISDKIVCLHIRDSAYLSQLKPEKDFSYHRMRDSSIECYEKAIHYLIELGYKVVRLGGVTSQRLNNPISGYLDLCGQTSALLDLALYDSCEFFLGTNSGPLGTAAMFDVPTLLVNCAPAVNFYATKGRCIYKTLWKDSEMVDFNEIVAGKTIGSGSNVKIRDCYDANVLAKHTLQYEENSEEEILQAVIEFERELCTNDWSVFGPRQQHFLASVPPNVGAYEGKTIPTESFLERYYDLNESR